MTFDAVLVQVLDLLQRQGRVSYRALKRRFDLDDAYLEDLKDHPRDPVQAGVWMRLAAKDNKKFYQDELGVIERQLTPDQVAKAKALAAEWKPKQASNVTKN